jgi:hypothetical protein
MDEFRTMDKVHKPVIFALHQWQNRLDSVFILIVSHIPISQL